MTLGAVSATLLVSGILDEEGAVFVGGVISPIVALLAAIILYRRGRETVGRDRLPWMSLAGGVFLWTLGDFAWAWYEQVLRVEAPFPGIPDVFYIAGYLALAAAIVLLPYRRATGYRRVGAAFDALIGTAALSILAWAIVFRPIWAASEGSLAETLVVVAYPVGDLLLLSALMVLATRRASGTARLTSALAAALALVLIGDITWLIGDWTDTPMARTWAEASWILAYMAFAIAGSRRPTDMQGPRSAARDEAAVSRALPYAAVAALVGFTLLGLAGWLEVDAPVLAAATVVVAIVPIRQWVSLQENRQRLEAERRQLVSVISHELRTPLTGVTGFLDLVSSGWHDMDESERRELVKVALDQSRQLSNVVGDLIAVSSDREHPLSPSPEPFSLRDLVGDAVAAVVGVETRPPIEIDVPDDLVAAGDRSRLLQVVTNLLSNAVKYGGNTVVVRGRNHEGRFVFEVHDDGPGIASRHRPTIWESFERGDHALDASTPGSGLGLAIVRSIVSAHGGSVGYRTSPLGGACFTVSLPGPRASKSRELLGAPSAGAPTN